ncbi:hypothetical protein MAR_028267 [Mya arenaria]|uniref:Uncharacterized protein n=1 Tax=Mya arenaria TaxID=6604 RepID=A0ABY7DD62_MYAAR|nr:hypothetical protein MAR_028267 [Mya arenaria]
MEFVIDEGDNSCHDQTWRLYSNSLMLGDDSYQATAIDTVLKLVERVGCEDLDLLNELSLELGAGGEGLQSAVAYMFIFVCGEERGLSPRIHQQLHTGIITMLTSAQALPVQINGLGNI